MEERVLPRPGKFRFLLLPRASETGKDDVRPTGAWENVEPTLDRRKVLLNLQL
ncbi:hypothetical protein D3C81_1822620 [compost metagenome]